MKVECLKSKVSYLQEQLVATNYQTKALEQEKISLARDLEVARFWEHAILDKIFCMLFWAQLAEEKASKVKEALKDSLEKLTNSHLCFVSL